MACIQPSKGAGGHVQSRARSQRQKDSAARAHQMLCAQPLHTLCFNSPTPQLTHNPTAHRPGSEFLQFPGEYSFNLAEYMVLLDKPVGLTLAPEPHSGRVGSWSAALIGSAGARISAAGIAAIGLSCRYRLQQQPQPRIPPSTATADPSQIHRTPHPHPVTPTPTDLGAARPRRLPGSRQPPDPGGRLAEGLQRRVWGGDVGVHRRAADALGDQQPRRQGQGARAVLLLLLLLLF